MNLYMVYPKEYDWCCYVIAENRNRAKAMVAWFFGGEYIDYRVKTCAKGAGDKEMIIDSPDAEGYDLVLAAGFRYEEEYEG